MGDRNRPPQLVRMSQKKEQLRREIRELEARRRKLLRDLDRPR